MPLTSLLKKVSKWCGKKRLPLDTEAAFELLKQALIDKILLHDVQPHNDFILDIDASKYAIGACLQQIQNGVTVPLAYCSKTLSTSHQNYCTTKREMYACIYAMRYFQGFVKGADIVIRTDHAALKWLLKFSGSDAMYHRWIAEMQSYLPYQIEARSGIEHHNADGMSRARKDCTYEKCESCDFHHRQNNKVRDSDSVDSLSEEERQYSTEDRRDLAVEKPDLQDYHFWDLELIRREANDAAREISCPPSQCEVFRVQKPAAFVRKDKHRVTMEERQRDVMLKRHHAFVVMCSQ